MRISLSEELIRVICSAEKRKGHKLWENDNSCDVVATNEEGCPEPVCGTAIWAFFNGLVLALSFVYPHSVPAVKDAPMCRI